MNFPELEPYFQTLTDITDRIAMMNNHFDATPEVDVPAMITFYDQTIAMPWELADREVFDLFSSFFTFHVKTVQDIIQEAREILNPENREHVKKLVVYSKQADEWFLGLKKRRKLARTQVA